jgi:hypothetical protein
MQLTDILKETANLDPMTARIQLYKYVQKFPYRFMGANEPKKPAEYAQELLNQGHGDCRHKHFLLKDLIKTTLEEGEIIDLAKVHFDIRHLPLPQYVLAPFTKKGMCTIYTHMGLLMNTIAGQVVVDATWDPGLIDAGFPVTKDWDGVHDTLRVTPFAEIHEFGANKQKVQRDATILTAFGEALNSYIATLRKTGQ